MSLPAGARLGPYEILSALGAGGMGKARPITRDKSHRVYRFCLDRTVRGCWACGDLTGYA